MGGNGIRVGDRVFVNSGAYILAHNQVKLGDDVAVGLGDVVVDSDIHGIGAASVRDDVTVIGSGRERAACHRPRRGAGRTPLHRRAGAVVTRDVEDDTVVVGNPARVVRRIDYPDGFRKAWNNDWRLDHWLDAARAPHS